MCKSEAGASNVAHDALNVVLYTDGLKLIPATLQHIEQSIIQEAASMTVIQVEQPKKAVDVAPLFTPFKLGKHQLTNRMVYPPLTRMRATLDHVPLPHMATYYGQRAQAGSLFIAEGTYISYQCNGYARAPGVFTDEQVQAWKPIVQTVKDKGAVFFCQLWHCGRAAHPDLIRDGKKPVAPSANAISNKYKAYSNDFKELEYTVPEVLTKEGIKEIVQQYRTAARNALAAGFDGVEIHSANGYLLEEFIKSGTNKRTDEYGGSIENRCRLVLEVVDAVVDEVGAENVGIRLSPFTDFLDSVDETPYGTYVYLVEQLNKRNLVYVHMVEARIQGNAELETSEHTLEPFRKVWKGPFIAAGGFKAESGAHAISSGHADLVAYGRWWLANPDLPQRFKLGAALNQYDRATFYGANPVSKGYTDYPFLDEIKQEA